MASSEEATVIVKKRDLGRVAKSMDIALEKIVSVQATSLEQYERFVDTKEMGIDQLHAKRRKVMWF